MVTLSRLEGTGGTRYHDHVIESSPDTAGRTKKAPATPHGGKNPTATVNDIIQTNWNNNSGPPGHRPGEPAATYPKCFRSRTDQNNPGLDAIDHIGRSRTSAGRCDDPAIRLNLKHLEN